MYKRNLILYSILSILTYFYLIKWGTNRIYSKVNYNEISKCHNQALSLGYPQFKNVMWFWSLKNRMWVRDTLLINGLSLFKFLIFKKPSLIGLDSEDYQELAEQLENANIYFPQSATSSSESLFDILWYYYTFYSLSVETQQMFNAVAYKITSTRCWQVKHIRLDPPKVPFAPQLVSLLQDYTFFDTAQLIVCFTLDPYLQNHRRCCATTPDNTRCTKKRDLTFHPDFCQQHASDPTSVAVSV